MALAGALVGVNPTEAASTTVYPMALLLFVFGFKCYILFEHIHLCNECGSLSHQSGPAIKASVRGIGSEKDRCMRAFRNMVHAGIYLYTCWYYGEGPPFQVCTANITS